MFATYAEISDETAEELLYQLQELGYARLEEQAQGLIFVKAHNFVFEPRLGQYFPRSAQFLNSLTSENYNLDINRSSGNIRNYQQIWLTIQVLGIFQLQQILHCVDISRKDLEDSILQLEKVGCIQPLSSTNESSDVETGYRLINNSGSIAPVPCRNIVYDINVQVIYKLPM